ncbi:MAG: hypothetical protein K6E78_06620 [Treponema sp.]|nr:hypothetical protein [Treponema sp.]
MKKSRFALMTALAALLTIGFIGCSEPESATTSGTDTPSQPETPVTPDVPGSTFQEQINNAKEGATVTLNASLASAGKELTITKALTVDANNIEGLSVTVSSDVANQVVFKNFKKAKFDIISPVNRSISRGDESPEGEGSFKKFGDEALSLKLERCSIEELSTVSDLALFMGSGNDKSVIDSLILNKGAEDFTFIEFDESDTETADKSLVKDLKIEDGVKEINLIGGTFDDVNFAADFSDKVDFKYDKEFGDQLNFEDKEKFLEGDKVEAKDIALADDYVEADYDGLQTGYFMFTMSKDDFMSLNGYMDILFLTNAQADAWVNGGFDESVTFESPAYDMSLMGPFTVETAEDGSIEDGLYAVYGSSKTYRNYFTPDNYRRITLEKYMTYSKEAVVVEIKGDVATIYVNKGAIRKSDLLMCSGWRKDTTDDDVTGTCEGGTKLSEVSLKGYYPYFAIGMDTYRGDESTLFSTLSYTPISQAALCLPVSSKQEFPQCYKLYRVTDGAEYPDVSLVEYPDIAVPTTKVTVKYYDSTLKTCTKTEDAVVMENINAKDDGVEYYFDSDFTQILFSDNPDGNIEEWLWDRFYEIYDLSKESDLVLYARPKRTINFTLIAGMEGMAVTDITQLYPADSYFALTTDETVRLYKTAAEATDTALESFSNEITSLKDIEDNSTVYVVIPYVNLYAIGAEEGSPVLSLGKTWVSLLFTLDQNMTNVLRADFYSAATVSDANKYTMETISAVSPASKVYTTKPIVEIFEVAGEYEETPEKMFFADFYALLSSSDNTQKFYVRDESDMSNGPKYIECTKAILDAYLESIGFTIDMQYPVYKSLPDTTTIQVVDLNYGGDPVSILKAQFSDTYNSSYYKFYKDEEKKTEYTSDELESLAEGETVYVYSDILKVYEYHVYGEEGSFDDEPNTVTKAAWFSAGSMYAYYDAYTTKEMATKLTDADIEALEDGSSVYIKSLYVTVLEEYYDMDSETFEMLETTHWNNGSKSVAQIINEYYPDYERPVDPYTKKVYKSQDKTEEYTKDEILALTEGADAVLYIGLSQ